ncbi:MAG: diaminopimelate epimerase [Capsulimonadaceae bacterium]|nr:diaminopimelate epimerase [Capsulimonadaceae bacterium]
MNFWKMHGIGNDFLLVDGTAAGGADVVRQAREQAVALCDRRKGVGADGVIVVSPSDVADFRMRVFNADASEAEMCGNGIRCFAKFVHDGGLLRKTDLNIETGAGVLTTRATLRGGVVDVVEVDMGEARLNPADVPVELEGGGGDPVISQPLVVDGRIWNITCVSMGNPHCVVFVDDVAAFPVGHIGPLFENHRAFPRRTNTEFVQVIGKSELRMRVWERGSGETMACGTGACAAAVAGSLTGRTTRDAIVHLAGGDLSICWKPDNHVLMTGAAATVYTGVV